MSAEKQKQVHFKVGGELGEEPNLPVDCLLFLAEGTSTECTTTPNSPPQLPTIAKNLQHNNSQRIGAQPEGTSRSSHIWAQPCMWQRRKRLDPMKFPQQWIMQELTWSNNPFPIWWREIRACGKMSMLSRVICEEYNDQEGPALYAVTGSGLQAASSPAQRLWVVGCSCQCSPA